MAKREQVNPDEALTKRDYEIIAEFRYTLRKFLRFSEEAAVEQDLTPHQYQALLAIEGYPGRSHVSMGELAERLQIEHHSAVGLVDRLETAGLVKREPSEEDRRKVSICLTKQGLARFQSLYLVHREELATIGPRITSLLKQLDRK